MPRKRWAGAALFILFFTFFASVTQARNFARVNIPGAHCGNGSPYSVWLDMKQTKKLMIEFMGGGACWSAQTCFGVKLRTWMFPIPTVPVISWMSNDIGPENTHGLMADSSMIYFPYCTGDVHAGRHKADYGAVKAYHTGYSNVTRALQYLSDTGLVPFSTFKQVVLYGASAGAIGSLLHAPNVEKYLSPSADKIILADAPGMHFGETFWNKFSDELVSDYKKAFATVGINFTNQDTVMARYLPTVAIALKSWNVGILQGARDVVMSLVFGNISPNGHRELVYGHQGLFEMSVSTSNISVWLPDTLQHTFLLAGVTGRIDADGVSGIEFAKKILARETQVRVRTW
ncbi:MAG: hypothetical protein A2X86_03390 [Bdellovibrionales bacterium GWA2_49_15]|nr:MAG: hypothetical protein A2X86_03390 [Bdellovibrionales bacterium GWA2_49_15]HAZ12259.1 hypothetical protein [Bdellovibrionales bacterium]